MRHPPVSRTVVRHLFCLAGVLAMAGIARAAPPAAPLGVAMVGNTADSITLAWYRPTDEVTSYRVYAGEQKDGPFEAVTTVTERTATVGGLSAGVDRFYKVSALNTDGESEMSAVAPAFTIKPIEPTPLPVKIARNMCLSLNSTVVSLAKPKAGKIEALVDGSDGTSCHIEGACEVRIRLNPEIAIDDADYLLLNFRSDNERLGSRQYNINWRALKQYSILESHDSTDGRDGSWKEIASGENTYQDGVVVVPNNKPKWIAVKNSGSLQLCRLDVFRSAPRGERNDYWIFTGDSLIVQDMAGGDPDAHTVWFGDEVRRRWPDRYPIVVHSAIGGEMLENTFGRMKKVLPVLAPKVESGPPVGTFVCWESGFNSVGLQAGLWIGKKFNKALGEALELCKSHDTLLVPVRLEFASAYLDLETLEPRKYNIFHNTLAANLAGVDVFARAHTPYAVDPRTQLPYADYWTYTRTHHDTALSKDGVHHTKAGADGINRLWADVAGRMAYGHTPAGR